MASLAESLAALHDQGRLTPREVVEEARSQPAGSPLHDHFFALPESEAAERWRIDHARKLIRSYTTLFVSPDTGEQKRVRRYTSVQSSTGPQYRRTEEVVADPFLAKHAEQMLEVEINALVRKYAHLREFRRIILSSLGLPAADGDGDGDGDDGTGAAAL